MKKLLVVLLALTFVVAMATATFAVTTSTVDGKVEVTLDSTNQFGGSIDGKISFDLAKDFGNGYSAGLKILVKPLGDTDTPEPLDEVIYDGNGYIKMVKDFGTITLQNDGMNGNCAKDLGGKDDLVGGPGVKFESTTLVDGLALTIVANDVANNYNYLLKGDYTADALNIGAGYQSENPEPGATSAMAAWVGYTVSDAIKVGFEYTNRTLGAGPAATAMQVKFGYTAGSLTANALYLSKDAGYYNDDADLTLLSVLKNFKSDATQFGSVLEADAKYALSDTFSVNGTIEMAMVDSLGSNNMTLKVGCEDKLSDAVIAAASFTSLGTDSKLALTLTDTLAEGLVASIELDSTSLAGVDAQTYTAKVTATL